METLTSIVTYSCTLVGLAAMVIGGIFIVFVLGIAMLVLAGSFLEYLWKRADNKGNS